MREEVDFIRPSSRQPWGHYPPKANHERMSLHEAGGTSWIYISETPFTELKFPKVGPEAPATFNLRMLENVSIIGAVGLIAMGGLWLYSKRRSKLEESKKGES